jgi:hypothetical protein
MDVTMNEVSFSGWTAGDVSAPAHSFSAAKLLQIWERGQNQLHAEKALTLLAAAHPEDPRETLATLSIGRRDASLISLREELFGSHFTSLTDCPACGERLELNFNARDIRTSTPATTAPLCLNQSGYELQLRLPNSLDVLRLADCSNHAEMRANLFAHCVVRVTHEGRDETSESLPEEIVALAIARIAEADPQADVEVDLTCPDCGHAWQTSFDIVSYLWSELHAWSMELLREVHLLASSYGWRESDILTMTAQRRQCYLELLAG